MLRHTPAIAAVLATAATVLGQPSRVLVSTQSYQLPGSLSFSDSQVCADGTVAFAVRLGDRAPGGPGTGIGLWQDGEPQLLARTGDPRIGLVDRLSAPRIAPGGRVFFLSQRSGVDDNEATSPIRSQALWRWSGGRLDPVVFTGQPAPQVRDGAVHDVILDGFAVNDLGQVAFCSRVVGRGLPRTGIASLWLWSDGTLQLLAKEDPGDGNDTELRIIALNGAACLNASGEVLVHAWISTTPGQPMACVLKAAPGRLAVIAREGMYVRVGHKDRRLKDALPLGLTNRGEALLLAACWSSDESKTVRIPMIASEGRLMAIGDERTALQSVPAMGPDGRLVVALADGRLPVQERGATFYVGAAFDLKPSLSTDRSPRPEWLCATTPNSLGETLVRGIGPAIGDTRASSAGLWALTPGGEARLLIEESSRLELPGMLEEETVALIPKGIDESGRAVFEAVFGDSSSAILQLDARARCISDFDGNGVVDRDDLVAYIIAYTSTVVDPRSDTNRDGEVDKEDLARFVTAYFDGSDASGAGGE